MKMEKIDQKYYGNVFKNDGTPVPEDEWIVFRAKDLALPAAMDAYIEKCKRLDCDMEFIHEFTILKDRVRIFQLENQERCKIPD